MDSAFEDVIKACAAPRSNENETWITEDMCSAYCDLHRHGDAHSVEVWRDNALVGGLYGVALGGVFFGESMFSRENNASKIALVSLDWTLQQMNFRLIDCQIPSEHLFSLGARNIKRGQFLRELENGLTQNWQPGRWQLNISTAMMA
jgi:leucyl/phenylalanyl-tRNA--protein transferase